MDKLIGRPLYLIHFQLFSNFQTMLGIPICKCKSTGKAIPLKVLSPTMVRIHDESILQVLKVTGNSNLKNRSVQTMEIEVNYYIPLHYTYS